MLAPSRTVVRWSTKGAPHYQIFEVSCLAFRNIEISKSECLMLAREPCHGCNPDFMARFCKLDTEGLL